MHAAHTFRGPQQEEDAELLALQRIDDTSVKLQQEGKYLEALECMERGLVLRQHFFGADSEEVWRACKTVGEMCNLLAMTYLQQGSWRRAYVRPRWLTRTRLLLFAEDFAMVLELLKKADILTERDPPGRAVTYNNLACYYRRQGKLHAALSYLQKSLKIEAGLSSDDVENPADTHLNMCAVLSQLGRHQSALEHAQSALILLQEELFGGMNAGGDAPQKADRVAVLAIAYHNIGVEQEFLKKFQQSVASYGKGVEVAKTHLGPSHGITITLKNSLIAARRAISAKKGPKKSGTTRRKKGGRGVGRPMNPSDSNVEKWGNITGVYGDIPGVKGVEKQKKSTRGECNDGARCAAVMYGSPSPGLGKCAQASAASIALVHPLPPQAPRVHAALWQRRHHRGTSRAPASRCWTWSPLAVVSLMTRVVLGKGGLPTAPWLRKRANEARTLSSPPSLDRAPACWPSTSPVRCMTSW